MYIYTWQSPCVVAPATNKSNGSCIEYYITKVKENVDLTIFVMYDKVLKLDEKEKDQLYKETQSLVNTKKKIKDESKLLLVAKRVIYEIIANDKLSSTMMKSWEIKRNGDFKYIVSTNGGMDDLNFVERIQLKNVNTNNH